ncbi:MAG: bifunctional hydroxymethylpyrimidine kinase/phosphomethylpyrimidine kinase [Desulfobacteraceae bacterium]|nr:bifunctional hydroxymethylpyrimidine kinase/phosphomethylpyrimidine kinase [Desulfobacteraceae bacterium]
MKTETQHIPTVLSIAGSDPSGGAGIQADLKTFMAAGVYGAAVIAALTAQNTREVQDAMAVPAEFVEKQLESVLSDIRIDAVKLGMLPNKEVCEKIAGHLAGYLTICDPVMVSTSGHQLIDDSAIKALVSLIIPVSDYITPNQAELEILYGACPPDAETAGGELLEKFPHLKGIVIKGGHGPKHKDEITDTFVFRDGESVLSTAQPHTYTNTRNTHGTGCTFSSALASYLAQKLAPCHAFASAVRLTAKLIELSEAHGIGGGHGPLLHHKFRD